MIERNENFWQLYDFVRNDLMNQLSQLQRLEEEGLDMSSLRGEIETRINTLIESDDRTKPETLKK